jgi:hypothetical protein
MEAPSIEQSLVSYQSIAEHLCTIETAMRGQDSNAIVALSQQLLQLQEQVKANDTAIIDLVHADPSFRREPRLMELIDLIRRIHQHNERVTTQLRSIMVVHRDELMKMKKGNTALQGYRPVINRTGKRISISN